jgi:hypothetical protein
MPGVRRQNQNILSGTSNRIMRIHHRAGAEGSDEGESDESVGCDVRPHLALVEASVEQVKVLEPLVANHLHMPLSEFSPTPAWTCAACRDGCASGLSTVDTAQVPSALLQTHLAAREAAHWDNHPSSAPSTIPLTGPSSKAPKRRGCVCKQV